MWEKHITHKHRYRLNLNSAHLTFTSRPLLILSILAQAGKCLGCNYSPMSTVILFYFPKKGENHIYLYLFSIDARNTLEQFKNINSRPPFTYAALIRQV